MASPSSATILVVDDDEDVLTAARLLLKQHFGEVLTCLDPARIPALMERGAVDLFLLDMNFVIGENSGAAGLTWLQRILRRDADAVVVLMTAFGDLNTAVEALKAGAADFILKPWQNEKLLATLHVALELRRSRQASQNLRLAHNTLTRSVPDSLVADAPAMREVMRLVGRSAPTDANILILGESGTGKELIAQTLHALSNRANAQLVPVDLGATNANLFESELFGHKKGAFTDARTDRAGRFQAANGGTLFLDEIANLPMALQAKLLRALETREITPLGGDRAIAVDVRVLAASNRRLDEMVDGGEFREDLLYRINTLTIRLPPLRERLDDLPELTQLFMDRYTDKYQVPAKRLNAEAKAELKAYLWPGNVRELAHCLERAVILSEAETITVADLQLDTARVNARVKRVDGNLNLADAERRLVGAALARHAGNISQAANALGITRAALYRRMAKLDLDP
ncbi:MAG: sigma-54 dependent transcriptional regulator [Gammaproteobacteria bacterium]|nr:sigma-54 dependent transcriptional regulator [Gammaproteobacteria bacterium]